MQRASLGLFLGSLALFTVGACSETDENPPSRAANPGITGDSGAPPIGNQPVGNQPIGNQPIGNQPIGNQPVGNQPIIPMPDGGGFVPEAGPVAPVDGGSDGGAPISNAAACTGKPGMRRGKSNQTMMAGGLSRSFIYYAPKNLDPNKPVPLVIVPHGTNMSGEGMYGLTDYASVADREGFVAIFPDGEQGPGSLFPWNVGQGICGLGAFVGADGDDQAFVDELIKFAEADQCIDSQHIFMTGFSMGGYFSNETGCMNSKIRAVGPHSGGSHDLSQCKNQHKPVIIFHFEGDSLIDYACGSEARDNWVKRNGCTATGPEVVQVKGGRCEYYKGCPADGQVALCSFTEGYDESLPSGHGWSGAKAVGPETFAAITSTESATELGWAFFKKYAW